MTRVAIDLGTEPELSETPAPDLQEWVDFVEAGSDASGGFRCADCGYGVVVQHVLPPCPMCHGAVWERRDSRFAL